MIKIFLFSTRDFLRNVFIRMLSEIWNFRWKFCWEMSTRSHFLMDFIENLRVTFLLFKRLLIFLKNILISKIGIIVDILKSKCFFFHYWNMQIFEGYSYENIVKNMNFFIKILVENVSNKSIFSWILLGIYV